MDKFVQQPIAAPSVINEVSKINNQDHLWQTGPAKSDETLAEVSAVPPPAGRDSQVFFLVLAAIAPSRRRQTRSEHLGLRPELAVVGTVRAVPTVPTTRLPSLSGQPATNPRLLQRPADRQRLLQGDRGREAGEAGEGRRGLGRDVPGDEEGRGGVQRAVQQRVLGPLAGRVEEAVGGEHGASVAERVQRLLRSLQGVQIRREQPDGGHRECAGEGQNIPAERRHPVGRAVLRGGRQAGAGERRSLAVFGDVAGGEREGPERHRCLETLAGAQPEQPECLNGVGDLVHQRELSEHGAEDAQPVDVGESQIFQPGGRRRRCGSCWR